MADEDEEIHASKEELLTRVRDGRAKLEAVLARLNPEQIEEPALDGGWSVKDVMAHLAHWEQDMLARVGPGGRDASYDDEAIEAINERQFQANRDRRLDDVRAEFAQSYERTLAALEAWPEEYLLGARELNGNPRWWSVVGNTFGHYDEHREAIEGRLAGRQTDDGTPG